MRSLEGVVRSLPTARQFLDTEMLPKVRMAVEVRVPLTIAPAERGRLTGGVSEPSRCHGVLLCFSLSSSVIWVAEELCLLCRLKPASGLMIVPVPVPA